MKRIIVTALLITLMFQAIAQDETERDEQKGFRRDNIFVGGSIGLGLGNGSFNVGINPELGYSIASWLDAGISANTNYASLRANYNYGYRQREVTLGGGMFARIYIFKGVFAQVLPEYNWITTKLKDMNFNGGQEVKIKAEAPSLLLGVGYGRRVIGASTFFTTIMFDAGNNPSSPYIGFHLDQFNNPSYGKLPIIRSGFNLYLRPKNQR
jgi:hypothetical protein